MRTIGIVLGLLAVVSALLAAFRAEMPFRIPVTAEGAGYWAAVLLVAALLAWLASLGQRR